MTICLAAGLLALPLHAGPKARTVFESPETCRKCHSTHFDEWQGSMMHYSAQSPVYQTFELTVRKLTGRFGVHDQTDPTFCNNCHSPIASYQNDLIGLLKDEPTLRSLSPLGKQGVSCTMCHSIKEPHYRNIPEKGLLGDSMANADVRFFPAGGWVGPTTEAPAAEANEYHSEGFYPSKKSSQFLGSSAVCGSCHNVHLPGTPDTLNKTPYQVEQNTFGEWKNSPYNSTENAYGKIVSCQDCHMSPSGLPGNYPLEKVAQGFERVRKHTTHRFTAASVPLIDDEKLFPNRQKQIEWRERTLKQACTIAFQPAAPDPTQGNLPLRLNVTNSGAGHRVPTGLSQERELWLELVAKDTNGEEWYRSGSLVDSPHPERGEQKPDGTLADEDLATSEVRLSPTTLQKQSERMLGEFNLRPFANEGVPTFNNAFMKASGAGWERVYFFSLANHIDNTRSLPPLQPVEVAYDLPLAPLLEKFPSYCGPVEITANLLYRSFSPKILRALSVREPELLREEHIDRNTVVSIASAGITVPVCPNQSPFSMARINVEKQTYSFEKNGLKWIAFFQPNYWEKAKSNCKQNHCRLASGRDYDSLGFQNYRFKAGDNVDELWKERWTSDHKKALVSTYTPLAAPQTAERALSEESLDKLPYFCVCERPKP